MDTIHSYFLNDTFSAKENNIARSKLDLVSSMSMLSCKFLKKHGYTTILYTSQSLVPIFKNHPYDDIITIDEHEYDYIIQDHFWSGTKLVACSKHNNPYFHIDTDLFLIEDVLSDHLNDKFVTLHEEPWTVPNIDINFDLCNYIFNTTELECYNCAVFGGSDPATINHHIKNILLNTIAKKSHIDTILKKELINPHNKDWIRSVFIEQMLLTGKIKKNIGISTVVDASECDVWWAVPDLLKAKNIIHLWTYKDPIHYCMGIDNLIKYMTKYYF